MSAPEVRLSARLAGDDLARRIAALGSEPTACLLCAGRDFERLFRGHGKWYWSCRSCALVFVHDIYPEFEDTSRLDGSHAGPQRSMVTEGYDFERLQVARPRLRRKLAAALRGLEPHRSLGRLLDVGCGQGLFLAQAAGAGWQVQGVELLPPLAELARRRGLTVFTGELAAARFAEGSFDVVTMSEVIEHVVEPVPLMREVARVLRPGGVAVLGTGNARSWAARVRGADWPYYRFGGHLHIRFYSPSSAAALARAAGFARVEARTRGFALREAEELRARWYKPLCKLAQAPVSLLAGAAGAGHRLVMTFHKAAAPGDARGGSAGARAP